jgi:PKD repeat protein
MDFFPDHSFYQDPLPPSFLSHNKVSKLAVKPSEWCSLTRFFQQGDKTEIRFFLLYCRANQTSFIIFPQMKKAFYLSVSFLFMLVQSFSQSASFTSDSPRCSGDTVHFTPGPAGGSILMEEWDFGDGTSNTYLPPAAFPVFATHVYSSFGNYNVTRTVKFSTQTLNFSSMIQVLAHPVAAFIFPAGNCIGSPVSYTDQSYIPSGIPSSISTWVWDFGDGTPLLVIVFPGNPNVLHTFPGNATSHVVRLTVTTAGGCSNYIENTVYSAPDMIANFFPQGASCELLPIQFYDLSSTSGGTIVSWNWNFGDPPSGATNTSVLSNPIHVFTTAGTFIVTLTIVNSYGCSKTISKAVSVNPHPFANFTVDTVYLGTPTTFTDQSITISGGFAVWLWEFGDGQSSSLSNPSHFYASPLTYMANLTVTDLNGCTKDTSKPVIVLPPVINPPANQTISNVIVESGQTKCYNATQVIAGQKISFLPGTTVQPGGSMWGYIAPMGPFCQTPSMPASVVSGDTVSKETEQPFFKIHPNPTTGNFILEFNANKLSDKATLAVYGIRGEKVLTTALNNKGRQECSLTGLPGGIYFLRVNYGERFEMGKIIKQ